MVIFNTCYFVLYMVSQEFRMVKNLNFREIFIEVFRIILLIIMIFVAFQVLKAILGGTWETENIIIAGMGIILAGFFVIVSFLINQGEGLGRLEERSKNMGESLVSLGRDFKEHLSKHKK